MSISRFLRRCKTPDPESSVRRRSGAFSLPEVVIAMALVATTVGSSLLALTTMNNTAQRSRLRTGALSVAQNHIDDALNRDWNAMVVTALNLSAPLTIGTHWVIPNTADADNDGLIAYYDADETGTPPFTYSATQPTQPNVPIYEENPLSNVGITINSRVRVVTTDITPVGAAYPLRRIVVTVLYNYRGRNEQVELTTLRTSN